MIRVTVRRVGFTVIAATIITDAGDMLIAGGLTERAATRRLVRRIAQKAAEQ